MIEEGTPEEIAPWLFSADSDRPVPECFCRSCRSECFYPIDATCAYYRSDD